MNYLRSPMPLPNINRDAILSGHIPELRDWRNLPVSELTTGEKVCRFIESTCIVPEGELVGTPVVLDIFQELFYIALFDNPAITDTAILSIARKNTKTATIAFLVIAFLVGPVAKLNSRLISGAMSREQAAEVYNLASKCISLSPKLREHIKQIPSSKILVGLIMNVEYRAISADANTAHGKSPLVAILDEMGQIKGPQSDFVDAITTAQGAYQNPLLVYISTQAATDQDFFSIQIDDAAASKRPKTVCHVYRADEDCDVMDEKQWYKANPALGRIRSLSDMRKQAEKASRIPSFESTFRNLNLNQRVSIDNPFVSPQVWKENGEEPRPLAKKKVYGGLDLSAVSDLTGLVLVGDDGDVECNAWLPREGIVEKSRDDRVPYDVWHKQGLLTLTPGRAIRYDWVAHQLRKVFDDYEVVQINFDRYNMKFLRPELERAGFTEKELEKFKEFGQGFVSMSPALRALEAALLQKSLRHGNHPILTMCAGNAVVELDAAGNRKFTKKKATGRIDLIVCLAMAEDARVAHAREGKKWSVHF